MWQIILASTLIVGSVDVSVQPLEGKPASGALTAVSADGVTIEQADGESKSFQPGEIQIVTVEKTAQPPTNEPTCWVELTDGTFLPGMGVSVVSGKAKFATLADKPLEVSKRVVHSIRLRMQDSELASQWNKIRKEETEGDLLVVRKNPTGADGKPPYLDFLEGIILGITDKAVIFEFEEERIDVPIAKVEGVVYFHAAKKTPANAFCGLEDNRGAKWQVQTVKMTEEGLALTTISGLSHTLPLDAVNSLDFSGGNRVYLSSLEPVEIKWSPFFRDKMLDDKARQLFGLQRDKAITGGKITLAGKAYAKGVAIPSKSELIYPTPEGFRHFKAIIGIDDATRPRGHVTVTIYGDKKSMFEKTITGRDEPVSLDLDMSGIRRLKIVVGYGENFDVGDHLDFADARFTK